MLTEAYVAGLTKDNARMLLDRAKELGLPASVVKTVDGGFIVPAVLVEDDPKAKAEPDTETEDETAPDAPEDDDTEADTEPDPEPEEQPAPKRRAPARRTKTKAADDDQADEPAESEE